MDRDATWIFVLIGLALLGVSIQLLLRGSWWGVVLFILFLWCMAAVVAFGFKDFLQRLV